MRTDRELLCICCSFPPEIAPTSIRTAKLLSRLSADWPIQVITAVDEAEIEGGGPVLKDDLSALNVHRVKPWNGLRPLLNGLIRIKLHKIISWFIWPDETIFWVLPALRAARQLHRRRPASAIVVFMMPYSAGIIGILLKRATQLPLILNLDDSLTCHDMNSPYPSRLHYHLARRLEDWYMRSADAVIYVSQVNLEQVRARQRPQDQAKFHLVRYGADPADYRALDAPEPDAETAFKREQTLSFNIVYIGGMTGWYQFFHRPEEDSRARRLFAAWTNWGRYEPVALEHSSSSPVYIGRAAKAVASQCPAWHIKVRVYGNKYAADVVERVLANTELQDVVEIHGSVPNTEAIRLARQADLLFIALPGRADGSPGGRISAKTYEYLMTDRPILAAVPQGENRNYLEGKPGIWIVAPDDAQGMQRVIAELAAAKFAGHSLIFDRSALRSELSYDNKAAEFENVIGEVLGTRF